MKTPRPGEILRLLAANDIEFIVVGMAAGILQGAPVTTVDLDIVHRRSPGNVARLLRALAEIDAVYRGDPRMLQPTESLFVSPGHQLLTTVVWRSRLPGHDRRRQGLTRIRWNEPSKCQSPTAW